MKKQLKKIKRELEKRFFLNKREKRHELVGPPKLWKMKQEFQINFIKKQGIKESNTLLDIGCGTLRGGIPIIDFLNSGNYCGIEVRESVLNEGKKELEEHNLLNKEPRLVSFSDFNELNLNNKFDVIFCFSVLIHLEDKIASECIKFVTEHLKDEGVFYANVNIGERKDGNWQEFPIVFRSLDFYRNMCEKNGLKLETIGSLGSLGHNSGVKAQDDQIMLKITKK